MAIPKINNRELKKLIDSIGAYRVEELYFMSKLKLTSKQLDYVIERRRKDEKHI